MSSENGGGSTAKSAALTRGTGVFVALLILTIIEYFFGIWDGWNIGIIMVLAIAKAALIVWYFMYIKELGRSFDEAEESA